MVFAALDIFIMLAEGGCWPLEVRGGAALTPIVLPVLVSIMEWPTVYNVWGATMIDGLVPGSIEEGAVLFIPIGNFLVLISFWLLALAGCLSEDWFCCLFYELPNIALAILDMSVPKNLLIEDVRFAGLALAAGIVDEFVIWACEAEDMVGFWCWLALSTLSVALLKEFLFITITFEFSLFPFFKSYILIWLDI